MSTISSTQIRIDGQVKLDLEHVRDNVFNCKTHSFAIQRLLIKRETLERIVNEMKSEAEQEKRRQQEQDLCLGVDRKNELKALGKSLGISDPVVMVDFLIHHFNSSDVVSKDTMIFLAKLR